MRCEYCESEHDAEYGSGRFCNSTCARGFSTRAKRADINARVSLKAIANDAARKMHTAGARQKRSDTLIASYGTTDTFRLSESSRQDIIDRRELKKVHIDLIPFDELSRGRKYARIRKRGCCEMCSIRDWQGKPLTLEIDHIDGDRENEAETNLRLLCPNCHALTPTFRGRNIKCKISKSDRVSDQEFIEALKRSDTIREAIISLGLNPSGGNHRRANKLIMGNI